MANMDNLGKLPEIAKGAPAADEAFWEYAKKAMGEGAIPVKYKELIAIAVGLTTQCEYCIEVHKKAAIEAGATPEELAEVVHVTSAIRAGGGVTHGTHLF